MKKKVLVVDDDAMNRRLFNVVLTSEGYETVLANAGEEAVDLARKEMPDLILLDMCMPDIDGLKVNEMIKQDQRLAGVPVIAAAYGYCDLPPAELGADAVIDSLSELIPALEKL